MRRGRGREGKGKEEEGKEEEGKGEEGSRERGGGDRGGGGGRRRIPSPLFSGHRAPSGSHPMGKPSIGDWEGSTQSPENEDDGALRTDELLHSRPESHSWDRAMLDLGASWADQ